MRMNHCSEMSGSMRSCASAISSSSSNTRAPLRSVVERNAHQQVWLGIEQVRPGNRLGDIGAAIQKHAEAAGFSVVREFCGHGIGRVFHEEPQVLHYGNARNLRDDELAALMPGRDGALSHVQVTEAYYAQARAAGYDDVTAMQYVDLFTWLRGDILVKADKMTMANSLELRVPFLDPEVFALAATLPLEMRTPRGRGHAQAGTTKYALRQAMRQIVPPRIMDRRKLGFPVPTADFLAGPLHDWARDVITSSQTEQWLDRAVVLGLLERLRAAAAQGAPPSKRTARQLWEVLVFMVWHGIFVEERIAVDVPETVYPVTL